KRLHAVNERLFNEMEQHQALQKSLEHARYHDPFTGLPNRRYLMDQLDRALREVRTRRRRRIAVVLIEIDRFKLINDTLGHTAGDELMLQAAQRFAGAVAGIDCVLAHWEGGQLALLLYEVESPEAAQALAAKLLSVRQDPFTLRQQRITVASRIGLTCIDSGLQRVEEALREADIALSFAKRQPAGRGMAPAPAAGHRLLPERESLRGQLARSGVARLRGAGPSGDPYLAPAAEVRAHRGRSHQQRERRAGAPQRLPQHGYRADAG